MSRLITAAELAEILDITERRVNQIAKDEIVFQRDISGNFDVVECVKSFYKNKFVKSEEKVDYDTEKALHERVKREKAELQLRIMEKELHSSEDVEMILTDMLLRFRRRILAMPSRLAGRLVNLNKNKIKTVLNKELKMALNELSEYDPDMFDREIVQEGGEDAEENGQPV